jgi:hypothetical protein
MPKFLNIFLLAGGLLASGFASAQGLGNSPYSRLGLGDLSNGSNIRNFSMGGAGIASPNSYQLNYQNPALLYYNNNVIFELSAVSQLKTLKQDNRSQKDGSVTLNTLGFGVPLSKHWTAAIGLRPFSSVQYEVNTTQPFAGDPSKTALVKYTGDGSLSEVYFAHGVKVAKDLTLGASASYLFGTLEHNQTTGIEGGTSSGQLQVQNQTKYSDFTFRTGLAYRYKVGKYKVGLGGLYNFGTDLDAKRQTIVNRPVTGGVFSDTLNRFAENSVKLPGIFQVGLSLDNAANWSLALDVAGQQWANYRNFDGQQELQNAMRVSLGGEYVPEPASPKYLRRVTYRAGLSAGQTPYELNGKQLNDMAVTWGFTLPLGRALVTETYFLNLGFALGKRGTTESQLIQENYFQLQAGVSLSNKWFIRRQLD